ncbi:MAG: hypothetical protein JOZ39_06725 [Chloroflexi bacterium]|nr:hypothetical protein [Chloroflexota bacterium]
MSGDILKAAGLVAGLGALWALEVSGIHPLGVSTSESPPTSIAPIAAISPVPPGQAAVRGNQPFVALSPGSASYVPPPKLTPPPSAASSSAPAEPGIPVATAEPVPSAVVSPSRVELRSFASAALDGRGMPYFVYLPAGYDTSSNRRYPVLFLLHGIGGGFGHENGSDTEWYGYGVTGAADELFGSGRLEPFLIVLPQGDQSFWMDHADGPRWGQYVARDLVAEIEANFKTLRDSRKRAIGGLSMGGFGALSLAMLYPDVFTIAGGHSASWYSRDAAPFFGDDAFFAAHDPIHLLHDHVEVARGLQLWLDVGASDPLWRTANENLHQQLQSDGVDHRWNEWPGAHDGLYWNAHMTDYLAFYGDALKGSQ